MPTKPENVRSPGWTGSHRRTVKTTRMDPFRTCSAGGLVKRMQSVESVKASAYEFIRSRCVPARASSRSFAACNEATALCGPPHWPRPILEPSVFLPTMSGAGGPCAHTWFGDRSPGIRMSVWGRWHPLRPQTSWVGRLLAGELTPKLAAEALQGLGTPGRALRDH